MQRNGSLAGWPPWLASPALSSCFPNTETFSPSTESWWVDGSGPFDSGGGFFGSFAGQCLPVVRPARTKWHLDEISLLTQRDIIGVLLGTPIATEGFPQGKGCARMVAVSALGQRLPKERRRSSTCTPRAGLLAPADSRRRDCHLMAPPCTCSGCFNRDKQGVPVK